MCHNVVSEARHKLAKRFYPARVADTPFASVISVADGGTAAIISRRAIILLRIAKRASRERCQGDEEGLMRHVGTRWD